MPAARPLLPRLLPLIVCLLLPAWGICAEGTLSAGDTAWMMAATALVLFMTLPGLALFYGGLVRSKNVLSVLVQCFAMAGAMSILWVLVGYSLAFEAGYGWANGFLGGFKELGLVGLNGADGKETLNGSIPKSVWVMFQGTFFIITPALIAGAFAERMKFSAMLVFAILWGLLCYIPICHMAWGGGWFHAMGATVNGQHLPVLDFAGGTVVHINAGIAALVAAIMVGKRQGYDTEPIKPHNLTMTVTGAGMLWVGWFGFNGGSAAAADGSAGMAILVTNLSAACGAMTWTTIEWIKHGRPSALGIVSGAVGGLVAITPAAGNVGPLAAIAIGIASGLACYWGAVVLKKKFGYDDSLDAFGVHGIGGILGALLVGIFCMPVLGGTLNQGAEIDAAFGFSAALAQTGGQAISILITLAWSGVLSFLILKLVDKTIGLRVNPEDERMGLDLGLHDERGYIL